MLYMLQTITAKLQILVNPSERQVLCDTAKAYTDACNYVSEYIFKAHNLNRYVVQKDIYYQLRENFGLPSQMAVSCIRTAISHYKIILTSRKEWTKPSFSHPRLELVWNRDYSLNLKKDLFSINTLNGRIKGTFCKKGFEQYFTDKCVFGTARIIYKYGKFFLYVPITYEISVLHKSEVSHIVGIDRGIRFLAVSYDSKRKTVFFDGNIIKKRRAHFMTLRKQLQKVGTSSSRRRIKAIGQRENRWMQDVNHCISKALVESNPKGTLFVIEDLTGIRSVTEKVRVKDRYVSVSWAYYDLEQKLYYKALRHHQLVEKVNAAFTSMTCPKCGHAEKGNRNKKTHNFRCKNCGYRSNDDRVAAMNLYQKGVELLLSDAVAAE